MPLSLKLKRILYAAIGLAIMSVLLFLSGFIGWSDYSILFFNLSLLNNLMFLITMDWSWEILFFSDMSLLQSSFIFLRNQMILISAVLWFSIGLIIGIYFTLKYQNKKGDQKSK